MLMLIFAVIHSPFCARETKEIYKDNHLCLVTAQSISLPIQDVRHRAKQPITVHGAHSPPAP